MDSINARQLRRRLLFNKEPHDVIIQKFKIEEEEFKKKEEEKKRIGEVEFKKKEEERKRIGEVEFKKKEEERKRIEEVEFKKRVEERKRIGEEEFKKRAEEELLKKRMANEVEEKEFIISDKLKIYILHYKKLIERKEHIKKELNKHFLTYQFYEKYDKEELTKEDLSLFSTRLRDSEKSLLCKHIYVYREMIQNNDDYILMFEDDVVLDENFNQKLNTYLKELPNDWDMLFIGSGCNLHIPKNEIKKDVFIYKKSHKNGSTRCTDSYLIRKKCAQNIINIINNTKNYHISKPADWWLNDMLRNIDANVYWCEPTIVKQGTQNNIFKSSIR
jgi:glycosyl transferase family 25